MKIYLLRHEDRTMDLTFFSPLTKNGLDNSKNLIKFLEKEKINSIYSSPYIRTLQTIYPYAKKYNLETKLEYSLTELYQEENIPKKSYQITLPEYISDSFNYDKDYNSLIIPNNINFPEDLKDFNKRIKNFLKNIIKDNYSTDKNILLVTHQGVIDLILFTIMRKNGDVSSNLGDKVYPKGGLTKIFEDFDWVIDKINW
jgi:2,3-bisphosphoglycerate-dependent phosphoglycerate mutase